MDWTRRKPTTPGLYWYRGAGDPADQDYEMFKIVWDDRKRYWLAHTHGHGSISVDSCDGEWCGPITPQKISSESEIANDRGCNARIAVRLQHGGSFYVENTLRDDVATALSEKLRALHKKGSSIPANLRAKITGLLHELIKFAEAPPNRE